MKKNLRGIGIYLVILLILLAVVTLVTKQQNLTSVKYSDIVKYFDTEQVESFLIDGNSLSLELKDKTVIKEFKLASVDLFIHDVGDTINAQRKSGVLSSYDYVPPFEAPWWLSMLPYLLLIVVFVLLWMYMINQVGAGGGGGGKVMQFGKAKTKLASEEKRKYTFNDVAGADEEKEELREVVEFLKSPKKFIELGARIPKGILLVGPPGTGKTLLAKAVAGEAGVPFFSISGSDFVEMFVGVGASRVRDLFDQAKKSQPCIVFIDEIDAVGRHRGAGLGGGHDEREQTLNQLLVEMDGFGVNEGVIIVAATNRPDILDPALLRPGRFDRQVVVGVPDVKGREDVLKVHARGKPLASDVNLATIAKTTAGFTGADLENLLNEAALLTARKNKRIIGMREIEESIIKVIAGPEKKSKVITDKAKRLTAYHEAGHAIVTRFLPTQDPVHQISIIPRGRAGGYTLSLPTEDKYYVSKDEMQEDIVTLLGGRVAEELVLGDSSTGASNDLERATGIARKMVTKYGMSKTLGPIVFGSGNDEVFLGRDYGTAKNYSESVAAQIDSEIKRIIDMAYQRAQEILRTNMDKLHAVAEALIIREIMDSVEFEAFFPDDPSKDEGVGPLKPVTE